MSQIHVSLLGKPEIEHSQNGWILLEGKRVQELFFYLLIFRNQPHLREALAEKFWCETPDCQAKAYLRRTLWLMQKGLNKKWPASSELFFIDADWVQVKPHPQLWLDIACLEEMYEQVIDTSGICIQPETAKNLRKIIGVYRGELLQGWYQEWCIHERERLNNIFFLVLDKLISFCECQGLYEEALSYTDRILQIDPARERSHRQAMRLRGLMNDRSGALKQYQICKDTLRGTLGVEPGERTCDLYRQLQCDRLFNEDRMGDQALLAYPETAGLVKILDDMKKLERQVNSIKVSVEHQVDCLEKIISVEPVVPPT